MSDFVAQIIALHSGVGVRLVVDPAKLTRLCERFDLCARQREQWPQQRRPAAGARRRHRGESVRSRAAQQLQQQCLGLVIRVMSEHDHIGVGAAKCRVARGTGRGFKALLACARNVDVNDGQRNAALRAFVSAECGPAIGVGESP
jgi:hypothetical protein